MKFPSFSFFIVCFGALLLSVTSAEAQKYNPGYIITLNNDTISGLIYDRKINNINSRLLNKIRFKDGGWFAKRLSPKDINGYCVRENCFESFWISKQQAFFKTAYISEASVGEKVFLKVIAKGKLSLYHWEFVDGESGNIEFIDLIKLEDNPSFVRATQGIFGLKKKRIAEYLSDYPEITSRIESGVFKYPEDLINYFNLKIK